MKNIWKYLLATAVLVMAAVAVTGCSTWQPAAEKLDKDGYTVSVRFDANGGTIAGGENAAIVDAFNLGDYTPDAEGNVSIRLLELSDTLRDEDKKFAASRTGYFLVGWYTERTPRVNDKGEALDDYGELTSVSGKPQGYTYGGMWNFETDRLTVNVSESHSATEPKMTLYAAWVPEIVFEFYALNGEGSFEPITTSSPIKSAQLTAPKWNEKTGKLDMNNYPAWQNETGKKTFIAAYLDAEMQIAAPDIIDRMSYVDVATGTGKQSAVKVYTTWQEGEWFRIYNADQFYDNSKLDGCYELYADLDFEKGIWSPTLASGEFRGTIVSAPGQHFAIKNVKVVQANNKQLSGGLFGTLSASAVIRDVTFENITYTVQDGSLSPNASFGLLAGAVREGATLENVSVSGTLKLAGTCDLARDDSIGLLFGYGSVEGLDHSGIECVLADSENTALQFEVDAETGWVTIKS